MKRRMVVTNENLILQGRGDTVIFLEKKKEESEENGENEGEKRKDVESLLQVLERRAQLLHSPTLWLTFSLSHSLSDRQLSLAVVSL